MERERQMSSWDHRLLVVDEVNTGCTGGDFQWPQGQRRHALDDPHPVAPFGWLIPPGQQKEAASGLNVLRGSRVRRGFSPPSGEGRRMRPKLGFDLLGVLAVPADVGLPLNSAGPCPVPYLSLASAVSADESGC